MQCVVEARKAIGRNASNIAKNHDAYIYDSYFVRLQESVDAFLGGSDVEAEPELAKLNEVLA